MLRSYSRHTNISLRVQKFFFRVREAKVLEIRRLRHTVSNRPSTEELDLLPIYQFLIFGKLSPHQLERAWFSPLLDTELRVLTEYGPVVRHSEIAEYPEVRGGWNCLNSIVDRVCFSFDYQKISRRWRELRSSATRRRPQLLKIATDLAGWLRRDVLAEKIDGICVRGQLGSKGRIPDDDVDLLVFVKNQSVYAAVKRRALDFGRNRGTDVRQISVLSTKFDRPISRTSVVYPGNGKIGIDIYMSVGSLELERVLKGDPCESRWNLGVMKACRPLESGRWIRSFVKAYTLVHDIRGRESIDSFHRPSERTVTVVSIAPRDLQIARSHGLNALKRSAPRIDLWDKNGSVKRRFKSPFVAAAFCEAASMDWESGRDLHSMATRYLLATMEATETWRFAPGTPALSSRDIDDTACSIAALKLCGENVGLHCESLFSRQLSESGLLRTWIGSGVDSHGRTNEADPIVTANALLALHRLGLGSTSLTCQLEAALASHLRTHGVVTPQSLYYDIPAVCSYFIARWTAYSRSQIANDCRKAIGAAISEMDVRRLSALGLAMLTCTAIRSGVEQVAEESVVRLLSTQRSDGLWPPAQAFVDPGGGIYGSPELTTALAVEALGLITMPSPHRDYRGAAVNDCLPHR